MNEWNKKTQDKNSVNKILKGKEINVIVVRKWVNILNLTYSTALNNLHCSHALLEEWEIGNIKKNINGCQNNRK